MIRTLWVLTIGALLTIFHASRVVLCSWLRCPGVTDLCDRTGRNWSLGILKLAGAEVRVDGLEHVDWSGPLVIVANHQSWFDVFALAAHLPVRGRFVAKQELGRIPIFGPAWKACGHISVDRSDRKQAVDSLDEAGARVRSERLAMILFPEGTRSPDGTLKPFKKGAFVLAIKTGVPIVPVGISGSREVMAKGSFRIRPGVIRVQVGKPMAVAGLTHEDRDRLRESSWKAVAALLEGDPETDSGLDRQHEERTA